ncbi:hypothetical protein QW060_27485 [Myroides ceti]|uniref:Lipoprotein n=1 Tax=Paenimyroides ceti TaxID=395087 RepID=A0ABT8D112_9FLAO|nr:hypothetical protein [Paenimyroides ceti]MDN3710538.1 hypothetical protein [Paenimyroides ceti]
MKKIILSLAVVAISMVSCNDASSDVQDQEVRAEAKKEILIFQKAKLNCDKRFLTLPIRVLCW